MAGVSDDLFALHISGLDRRGAFVVEAAGEVTAGAVPAARAAQHAVEAVEKPASDGKADEDGQECMPMGPFLQKLWGIGEEITTGSAVSLAPRQARPKGLAGCRFAIPSQDGGRRRVPWRL